MKEHFQELEKARLEWERANAVASEKFREMKIKMNEVLRKLKEEQCGVQPVVD